MTKSGVHTGPSLKAGFKYWVDPVLGNSSCTSQMGELTISWFYP